METYQGKTLHVDKRQLLRVVGGSGLAAIAGPGIVSGSGAVTDGKDGGDKPGDGPGEDGRGRGRYPKVESDRIPERGLSQYITQVAMHPAHDRAAFTTAAFEGRFQLYVAEGVTDSDDTPNGVWQITDAGAMELGPEWRDGNFLRYNLGLVRYEVKLPPSNKVFEPTVIDEMSLAGVNSL